MSNNTITQPVFMVQSIDLWEHCPRGISDHHFEPWVLAVYLCYQTYLNKNDSFLNKYTDWQLYSYSFLNKYTDWQLYSFSFCSGMSDNTSTQPVFMVQSDDHLFLWEHCPWSPKEWATPKETIRLVQCRIMSNSG